jgi:hypothetical protein
VPISAKLHNTHTMHTHQHAVAARQRHNKAFPTHDNMQSDCCCSGHLVVVDMRHVTFLSSWLHSLFPRVCCSVAACSPCNTCLLLLPRIGCRRKETIAHVGSQQEAHWARRDTSKNHDVTCQPAHLKTAASQQAASTGVCAMLQAITPGAAATRSRE